MNRVTDKEFKNAEVLLDGHHYERCRFDSCTFVYAATRRFVLANNHIVGDTRFEFTGAAADTLATLKAIYGMGKFGRDMILKTFGEIAPDLKDIH
jgi:hypothetical protein